MTTAPDTTAELGYDPADVHVLPAGGDERDRSNDRPPFMLGEGSDVVLVGKRPKLSVLLKLMAVMSNDADPLGQAAGLESFISKVLMPDSAEHVHGRLDDEDDDLDLDSPELILMFEYLVGLWYGGPTRSGAASRRSSSRTGQRSTGRRPSKGKTR